MDGSHRPPVTQTSWRQRIGATKVMVAIAGNVALAIVAYVVLGHVAGWASPTRASFPNSIGYGLPLAQFLAFGYLCDQSFRFFMRRMAETQTGSRPPPRLGLQIGRILIYFCVISGALSWVFNQSITGILAASGIAGLVMGFALRGLVSDLFSGIALHIDHNLSVGDWLDFSYRGHEVSGQLQDIHWRSVVLHDSHDNVLLIPNSEFATAVVTNRSKHTPATEYVSMMTLGSEYEFGRILTVLEMALNYLVNERIILGTPEPTARVAGFEGGLIKYRLAYQVYPGRTARVDAQNAVLRTAIQFLRSGGVYFYPLYPNYTSPGKPAPDRAQSSDVRARVLSGVALLRVLSIEELEAVAAGTEAINVLPGTVLINAGEKGDTMWVIAEGSLDVIVEKDGHAAVVTTLWPGDWVGEMSLLTGEPRTASVQARTSCVAYAIRKPLMQHLFDKDPNLVKALAQIAGRRRKSRERPYPPLSPNQDVAKTQSTVERICAFFGLQLS